jgi:peptide/nickel transport system ATP-binding protein
MSTVLNALDLHVRLGGGRSRGVLPRRQHGIAVIVGVTLTLESGQTLGLVGESGSGKTTLGRAIVGLVPLDSGVVQVAGYTPQGSGDHGWRQIRRETGLVFQDPVASLDPRMTVAELLVEPLLIHRRGPVDRQREAAALLDLVGLPRSFLDRLPHELSGGQARRVSVARALALRPQLVIADEPTAGLDVSVQGEILNLLSDLQTELGLAYLIITHNLAVARHVTDRIAILYLGRVVEEGPTEAVFAAPAHPYTLALLSAETATNGERIAIEGEVPSLWARPRGCEFHPRCPFAQDLCRARAPEPRPVAADHMVRCHFPHGVGRAA